MQQITPNDISGPWDFGHDGSSHRVALAKTVKPDLFAIGVVEPGHQQPSLAGGITRSQLFTLTEGVENGHYTTLAE